MHWPADDSEIGEMDKEHVSFDVTNACNVFTDTLNSDVRHVISGSCAGHLKLWSVPCPSDTLQLSHTVRYVEFVDLLICPVSV